MITYYRLKQTLDYDPMSGIFRWKVKLNGRNPVGKIAGTKDKKGYVVIRIDGVQYKAHRLAWFYMTGMVPDSFIDHKNLNKSDNRITNLRQANVVTNSQNRLKGKNNTSGIKGVSFRSGKWEVTIQANNKSYYIGRFKTLADAKIAREKAAKMYHSIFYSG